jgi:hypothetical protein
MIDDRHRAHRCLGVHFAYLEMKVILSMLLRTYKTGAGRPRPASRPGQQDQVAAEPLPGAVPRCWKRFDDSEPAMIHHHASIDQAELSTNNGRCPS